MYLFTFIGIITVVLLIINILYFSENEDITFFKVIFMCIIFILTLVHTIFYTSSIKTSKFIKERYSILYTPTEIYWNSSLINTDVKLQLAKLRGVCYCNCNNNE